MLQLCKKEASQRGSVEVEPVTLDGRPVNAGESQDPAPPQQPHSSLSRKHSSRDARRCSLCDRENRSQPKHSSVGMEKYFRAHPVSAVLSGNKNGRDQCG